MIRSMTDAGPFSPADFTDGNLPDPYDNPYHPPAHERRNTPAAKARVANTLIAFLEGGRDKAAFLADADVYWALSQKLYGHIAEFSEHGFYGAWFETPQRAARWVERAMKGGPYGFSDMARPRLWGDVERELARHLDSSGLGARIIAEAQADTEATERAQLRELLAKYPDEVTA